MPWALLGRLLSALAVARLIRRGRRPVVVPSSVTPAELRRRAALLVDDARLVQRVIMAVALGAVSLVGATVAVTILLLGPRWLGVVVAVVAAGALGFAALEASRARQSIMQRRWRRHINVVPDDVQDD